MTQVRVRDLTGRRVVIWGFGVEGQAAAQLLRTHIIPSALTVIVDGEPPISASGKNDLEVVSSASLQGRSRIAAAEVIVKSPGISPYNGAFFEAQHQAVVTGGTALWFAETGGAQTIGVTGSKGKSTTTSLVAHLLSGIGVDVVLAGNVGRALLDVLDETLRTPATKAQQLTYALELSSFQTAEVSHSPEIGILTALFPEHLDWHGSVDRYYADKTNLFSHRSDVAVAINTDNPSVAQRRSLIPGAIAYGGGGIHTIGQQILDVNGAELFDLSASRLPGRHNAINLCGALTALRAYGIDLYSHRDSLQQAIATFHPLEHRLQPVGEVGGRLVIDDSLSTAPQAAVAALAAFADRPVGIIVGGHDRGLDYQPLADALAARSTPTWVCGVPLSGERIVPLIERTLTAARNSDVVVEAFDDFDEAVRHAARVVPIGGVILLSPAAPSFGRFANYRDRGLHFRQLLGITGS
jgi:UDP-N-acetylmuramoyl-L-alanine---L-glutamate ligase